MNLNYINHGNFGDSIDYAKLIAAQAVYTIALAGVTVNINNEGRNKIVQSRTSQIFKNESVNATHSRAKNRKARSLGLRRK